MLIETLIALSGISIIILLHELGHYLTAIATGTKVKSFSLGFGPVLISYVDKRGTQWKLSLLPIGGYIEMDELIVQSDSKQYASISGIKLILIAMAGPATNLCLSIFLFTIIFSAAGDFINSNTVNQVFCPTNQNIIIPGDIIKSIDNQEVKNAIDASHILKQMQPGVVEIKILRNGQDTIIHPILDEKLNLGITFTKTWSGHKLPIITALSLAWKQLIIYLKSFIDNIKAIIFKKSQKSTIAIRGIVSIFSDMFTHMENKWNFLFYLGFISLSLGMCNLLPLPPLDGWNMFLGAIVALVGRKIPSKPYQIIQILGATFAILVMSYSAIMDIKRLI